MQAEVSFLTKYLKDFQGDSFWLSFFEIRAYCCCFSMFEDISLLIKLAKWQSITFADILTNYAEIPSGPLDLFTLSDLIILLMSLVLAYGRSNLFSGTHKFLIFRTLG